MISTAAEQHLNYLSEIEHAATLAKDADGFGVDLPYTLKAVQLQISQAKKTVDLVRQISSGVARFQRA